MKYTATLEAINSAPDRASNRYWALRFIDHETGNVVEATISGGESNIYAILSHWNTPDDWDRSVLFRTTEMGKRDFKSLTKDWPYAGCRPEDLAQFIRDNLG